MKPARFQFFFAPQIAKTKFSQNFRAAIGVIHFGMKLHAVEFLFGVLDGGDGVVRASGNRESCGNFDHVVAMAVPDFQLVRNAREQFGLARDIQLRRAVFASGRRRHFSTQRMREPLHAVADPQYGNAELQHFGIALRRVLVVHRTRPAGQNDADRLECADFFELRGARQNRGKHLLFADASRDQLRVLPAEIEDHNSLSRAHRTSGLLLRCGSGCHCHLWGRP